MRYNLIEQLRKESVLDLFNDRDKEERLNPENGICPSSLYDKAFDQGLITFSDDYKTILSSKIKANVGKTYYADFFEPIDGKQLLTPEKYFPNKRFLEYHRDVIFNH